MAEPAKSVPVRTLENVGPRRDQKGPGPAKAVLSSDQIGLTVLDVMKEGILAHYGSVKAAALSLHVDPSLMMREFDAGKFHRLEQADDVAKAAIFAYMHNAFGPLTTPGARMGFLLREQERITKELWQIRDAYVA